MLALSGDVLIASEPFNLDSWAYRLGGLARYWYTYTPDLDQDAAKAAFRRVIERRTGKVFGRRQLQRYLPVARTGRLLIKDPIASLSSEWLAQHFDLEVIVLLRHPAAFAASLQRMQWHFDFTHLSRQAGLMEELPERIRQQIESAPTDIIDQASLIWNIVYHVLGVYVNRHPNWIVVRHETLSQEPVAELRRLYERLGLRWSDEAEAGISDATGADRGLEIKEGVAHQMKRDSRANIKRWKLVLDTDEVSRIRSQTEEIADRYYTEADW